MPLAESKPLISQRIMHLQRPHPPISAQLVLTTLLPKGLVTLVKLRLGATMALCMQLPLLTLQDELVNEVERVVSRKTLQASARAPLTPLQCLLLLAKMQVGRSLHLLQCPSL